LTTAVGSNSDVFQVVDLQIQILDEVIEEGDQILAFIELMICCEVEQLVSDDMPHALPEISSNLIYL
jgi:hypothetical protein